MLKRKKIKRGKLMMKRITLFIASLTSGGAEHQLVMLAQFLREKGYLVTIVNYSDTPDHYSIPSGVKQVKLGVGLYGILKVFSIFKYFLTLNAEVVISFGQRDNFFCLVPLLFRRNIKVLAGERNYTIGPSDFYERWLLRILYKRANYIVPNSQSQREYILSKRPAWQQKVVTITNYTDLNIYISSSKSRIDNSMLSIAIFSRPVPQKNCLAFAEVIRILKNRIGKKIVFSWFGNMNPIGEINIKYLNELRNKINEYDINDMFILHDHVQNVPQVMSLYDAICLPSLKEGFSNTISEAICLGKPLLVSDVSDNKVMVHSGENGYLFDPTNINDIVNKIMSFYYLTVEQKQDMGRKSRKIAESLFQKDKFIDSYVKLIEQ